MNKPGLLITAAVACGGLFGQTPDARPEFEVASVKPSAPYSGNIHIGVHIDGAQVTCTYLSLKDYVRIAYQVKDFQVSGPEWMASERFDIAAKLPAGGTRAKLPEMLQSLLTDRFRVKLHHDTQEVPVYGLVAAKGGPKMKESAPSTESDAADPAGRNVNVTATGGRGGTTVNLGKGAFFTFADNKFVAGRLTMTAFADALARFVDRPVVDMTELTGNYDISMEFTPEDFRAMQIRGAIAAGVQLPPEVMKMALEGASQESMFSAVQKLGLRLERRKAPVDILVVDSAERTPAAN